MTIGVDCSRFLQHFSPIFDTLSLSTSSTRFWRCSPRYTPIASWRILRRTSWTIDLVFFVRTVVSSVADCGLRYTASVATGEFVLATSVARLTSVSGLVDNR